MLEEREMSIGTDMDENILFTRTKFVAEELRLSVIGSGTELV